MQTTTQRNLFTTIRTEGAILPPDVLQRISDGDNSLPGLSANDYHLVGNEKLNEAISAMLSAEGPYLLELVLPRYP